MKNKLIISILILMNLAFAQVTLWLEEVSDLEGTYFNLNYQSDIPFTGFQLVVNGALNIIRFGGTIPEIDYVIMSHDSTIVEFSFLANSIPAGSGTLFRFTSDTPPAESSFSGVVVVDNEGLPIPSTNVCAVGDFQCNSGECLTESLICDQSNDCIDNSDELYCNDFIECEGTLNILYVAHMINFVLGLDSQVCFGSDMNEDGRINIADAVMAINAISSDGQTLCYSDTDCEEGFACIPPSGDCEFETGPGECMDQQSGCSGGYAPVCGCDGITYPNECHANILNGEGIAYGGACELTCCSDPNACNYDPGCGIDDFGCDNPEDFGWCDCFGNTDCSIGAECVVLDEPGVMNMYLGQLERSFAV